MLLVHQRTASDSLCAAPLSCELPLTGWPSTARLPCGASMRMDTACRAAMRATSRVGPLEAGRAAAAAEAEELPHQLRPLLLAGEWGATSGVYARKAAAAAAITCGCCSASHDSERARPASTCSMAAWVTHGTGELALPAASACAARLSISSGVACAAALQGAGMIRHIDGKLRHGYCCKALKASGPASCDFLEAHAPIRRRRVGQYTVQRTQFRVERRQIGGRPGRGSLKKSSKP